MSGTFWLEAEAEAVFKILVEAEAEAGFKILVEAEAEAEAEI